MCPISGVLVAVPSIEQTIGSAFAGIPAVESVHVSQRDGLYRVFTITADEDEGIFDQIYDQERAIIRQFSGLRFDFNVLARRGRPVHELLTFATPTWERSDGDVSCPLASSI